MLRQQRRGKAFYATQCQKGQKKALHPQISVCAIKRFYRFTGHKIGDLPAQAYGRYAQSDRYAGIGRAHLVEYRFFSQRLDAGVGSLHNGRANILGQGRGEEDLLFFTCDGVFAPSHGFIAAAAFYGSAYRMPQPLEGGCSRLYFIVALDGMAWTPASSPE